MLYANRSFLVLSVCVCVCVCNRSLVKESVVCGCVFGSVASSCIYCTTSFDFAPSLRGKVDVSAP